MKTNEVSDTKRKSNHYFLFGGLAVLCIMIQIMIYMNSDSVQSEGIDILQLIILSIINPITALIYTLVAAIMPFFS